jgi:glycosyltransferase involved in cell wall biosynthesis
LTFRGGQEALLLLARGLRNRGHDQRIATPADSALARSALKQGFETIPLTGPLALRRELRGYQIVHSHSGRAQNVVFLASARLPVLRVFTRHVAFEPRHPMIHRVKYSTTCDGIIAVSEAVRQGLLSSGVSAEIIEVIPNGIEIPPALPTSDERTAARGKFSCALEHFVAGHLGAFTPEKGQDVAIAAAALLRDRLPQLRMILAGEGAPPSASGEHVILPGFVKNRSEFFAALDLFVMPSRSEGWGLAAAEALAHGLPVVASATGGLPEIVEAGETGWLVPPGDPHALASTIVEAASQPARIREMGIRARERSRRFSSAQTAELTEAFYTRLLQEKR